MTDAPDLATAAEARELLGDDDFLDLVSDGSVRRVKHGDGVYFMGCDIDKALRDQDPKHLAKLVSGEIIEDDADGDNPRSLAARFGRLMGGFSR